MSFCNGGFLAFSSNFVCQDKNRIGFHSYYFVFFFYFNILFYVLSDLKKRKNYHSKTDIKNAVQKVKCWLIVFLCTFLRK